jgi:hypothetical protein
MASASRPKTVLRQAPGYFLYLPPTPIKSRFVMLEETTKTFYDVDTQTPLLQNPASWATAGISPSELGPRPAIVFPIPLSDESKQILAEKGHDPGFMVGRLVSIESQEGKKVFAKPVGKVNVKPFPEHVMSWTALESMKGPVLSSEMKNGLMERLWGWHEDSGAEAAPFVTSNDVLDKMLRKWHIDPVALNFELDGVFASGKRIQEGEIMWVVEES